jgi:hypothetical protein
MEIYGNPPIFQNGQENENEVKEEDDANSIIDHITRDKAKGKKVIQFMINEKTIIISE